MSFSASRGGRRMAKETIFKSKQNILGPLKKVFRVLWPPEAKKDPHSENTKKLNFEKTFLYFMPKCHFWPLEAGKWQ